MNVGDIWILSRRFSPDKMVRMILIVDTDENCQYSGKCLGLVDELPKLIGVVRNIDLSRQSRWKKL